MDVGHQQGKKRERESSGPGASVHRTSTWKASAGKGLAGRLIVAKTLCQQLRFGSPTHHVEQSPGSTGAMSSATCV